MYQRSRSKTLPFYTVQIINVEMIRHIKFSKTRAVAPPRQNLARPKRTRRLSYKRAPQSEIYWNPLAKKSSLRELGVAPWTASAFDKGGKK